MTGDVRAVMVRVGDVTPAGVVDSVELVGSLRVVELVVSGVRFVRRFDDLVTVESAR